MKKISLKGLSNVLSENELKNIKGGYDTGGSCGYKFTYQGKTYSMCNVSYNSAYGAYTDYGGNWCCASCGSSSYCG